MSLKKVLPLVLLILFIQGIFAQVEFSEGFIVFHNEPETLSFTVKNDSLFDQELRIEFFGPKNLGYEFVGVLPENVKAGTSKEIKVRFLPSKDLTGSEYRTQLVVWLGNKRFEKTISMEFAEPLKEPKEENKKETQEKKTVKKTTALGFFGLASFFSARYLIDAVLVLVAAVLLIAFIARLVKRTQVRK
jgi:hypothetical protein